MIQDCDFDFIETHVLEIHGVIFLFGLMMMNGPMMKIGLRTLLTLLGNENLKLLLADVILY